VFDVVLSRCVSKSSPARRRLVTEAPTVVERTKLLVWKSIRWRPSPMGSSQVGRPLVVVIGHYEESEDDCNTRDWARAMEIFARGAREFAAFEVVIPTFRMSELLAPYH
jgi:hypothetical protein